MSRLNNHSWFNALCRRSLVTQYRREFWEARGSFLKTPLWIAVVVAALLIMAIASSGLELNRALDQLRATPEELQQLEGGADLMRALVRGDLFGSHPKLLRTALLGIGVPFVLVLLLVSQTYLLSCLNQDRRDRSILFWKSLPVSETSVVLTKLGFGVLVGPAVFIAASLVVGLLHLLMLVGYVSWQLGVDLPNLGVLLVTFLGHGAGLVSGWLLFSLWFLPLSAWLLLASAWSRKSPFLMAALLPLCLVVVELWLLHSGHFWGAISRAGHRAMDVLVRSQIQPDQWVTLWADTLTDPALWLGLLVSGILTGLAVWRRNNHYE
ncbi:hypothetical protein [Marinimicrobium sp. ARAG 43.8]|uniref:hypothetical protein n=1 Tax=Marinimicrobium sp. ARAG 43.8 TaxID=3418719 RepID=UPI003CE9CB53